MSGAMELTLPPEPATVGRARRAVRDALRDLADAELSQSAELVVSELVTNAVVHAGTKVHLRIIAEATAVRVEVEDGSAHLPVRRTWSETAGTGRGLLIVEEHADRWSSARTEHGKVVWFEIGDISVVPSLEPAPPELLEESVDAVDIVLRDVPLLMHWAWQEHATTLLREFLLFSLEDDPSALDDHAAASDALSLLSEQLPAPQLPTEPDALMASSVEPGVTAGELVLKVPIESLGHFATADDVLRRAVAAAAEGRLLGPPTQPEMSEMREWLCGEVASQHEGAAPRPWRPVTDVRVLLDPHAVDADAFRALAESDEALIATDETSVIVAVTPRMLEFLGYADASDLLGRRILVVVPHRFHQAHIAGTTLHVTNGRDVLLGMWIDVPMVRADGSEVVVALRVVPQRLEQDRHVFVASVRLPVEGPASTGTAETLGTTGPA